jgi:hypothetical protein
MSDKVLLLNASYEPLNTVTVARAQWLIKIGTAEIVSYRMEEDDEPVPFTTAGGLVLLWPTVIKLVRYREVPRYKKAFLSRRGILRRDDYVCCYCGGHADTMDHVIPRAKGGPHRWENVVACCFDCNQLKDCKTLDELGWTMLFVPYRPEGGRRIVVQSGQAAHPDWEYWLSLVK